MCQYEKHVTMPACHSCSSTSTTFRHVPSRHVAQLPRYYPRSPLHLTFPTSIQPVHATTTLLSTLGWLEMRPGHYWRHCDLSLSTAIVF
ncbi:hypothetical protein CC78DRAFT_127687 [Lojkania enalia]|uniref:Uncharacterized protein n=1 Tax=Lojkania enalia TaxID=147567 RepID=A0A9P4JW43_9PLEO|nr:hypothetical protein CC78DRAFT_127687 [Didymosphaeria enalia]